MFREFIQQHAFLRELFRKAGQPRARGVIQTIQRHLREGDKILDVGAGTCNIAEILCEHGHHVTALDVKDQSRVPGIRPVIYDGCSIPFPDGSFDAALLVTILHHTPNPERIITEAKRVAKRLIIVEDIYSNTPHKYVTYFMDSLFNYEFLGHPHSNKDDAGWRALFDELNLKLLDTHYNSSCLVFKHGYYFLDAE